MRNSRSPSSTLYTLTTGWPPSPPNSQEGPNGQEESGKEKKCGEEQSWLWDEGREWRRKRKEKQEREGRMEGRTVDRGKQATDTKNSSASLKRNPNMWHIIYTIFLEFKNGCETHFLPPGVGGGVRMGVVCLLLVLSSTWGVKDQGFIIAAASLSLSGNWGHCSGSTTRTWAFCTHMIAFL